jgi:glutamine amidotransferase
MTAIIDYGVGNLFSLRCSLAAIGQQAEVTADPAVLDKADRIILPGVGAFGDAADRLRQTGLWQETIRQAQSGKPLLGICLGMQLLLEGSCEYGDHQGLGLIPGRIQSIAADMPAGFDLKVPHMGWNPLHLHGSDPLLKYTAEGDCFYYVHSFYAPVGSYTLGSSEYGLEVSGVVGSGNVRGVQFHPEKSGEAGLRLLKAFAEL